MIFIRRKNIVNSRVRTVDGRQISTLGVECGVDLTVSLKTELEFYFLFCEAVDSGCNQCDLTPIIMSAIHLVISPE